MNRTVNNKFLAVMIFAGLLALGICINKSKKAESTLIVKGLAEKKVKADFAVWNLSGNYRGYPNSLNVKVSYHINEVKKFLITQGFSENEITVEGVDYNLEFTPNSINGYTATVNVKLTSNKVDLVYKTYSEIHELMKAGVIISGGKWQTAPRYYVGNFQEIKENLLKDACHNAHKTATDIVNNMETNIKIDRVLFINQGVLDIKPSDDSSENQEFYREKIYRLVSTVTYIIK